MMTRFCAVIPCYNHHAVIADTVRSLLEYVEKVIIVDDGSREETRVALEQLARQYGAKLYLHRFEHNQGKGVAALKAFHIANDYGFTHAVQVDADGQHDLANTPLLIEHARTFPNALVTAIPQYDETVDRVRFISRYITHFWVWIETLSFQIKDSMCGFRVYPLKQTIDLINTAKIGTHMDFDTDIMVKLYWRGVEVISVPTRVRYNQDGSSNFRVFKDNLLISLMHTKLFFGMLLRIPKLLVRNIKRSDEYHRHWSSQKEKGSYLGLKFLFTIYKWFGRGLFSLFLHPVMFFFFIFSPEKRQASRQYLEIINKELGINKKVHWYQIYRHFLAFGYSALDKLAAWLEKDLPIKEFHGAELYQELEDKGQGAVFIGSHLGNLEYCRALSRSASKKTINAVVYTEHAENFTRTLREINPDFDVNLVQVSSFGVDTAIKFREKINNGEILVIVGDRTSPYAHERNIESEFLGKQAAFPQGPFVLASLMDCPVDLIFCINDGTGYSIYLEHFRDRAELPRENRESELASLIQGYAHRLEYYCKKAPLQWFNFFDFWAKTDTSSGTG
jgi:predicted LPLAT superfamily acyltransferase